MRMPGTVLSPKGYCQLMLQFVRSVRSFAYIHSFNIMDGWKKKIVDIRWCFSSTMKIYIYSWHSFERNLNPSLLLCTQWMRSMLLVRWRRSKEHDIPFIFLLALLTCRWDILLGTTPHHYFGLYCLVLYCIVGWRTDLLYNLLLIILRWGFVILIFKSFFLRRWNTIFVYLLSRTLIQKTFFC